MSGIDIADLFSPAPDGVGSNPPPSGSWMDTLLGIAAKLSVPVTSWLPGSVARTMLAIVASTQARQDQLISTIVKGGYLDTSATITPDPTVPGSWTSSTWTPGWLDNLASGGFNCDRGLATYSEGLVSFTNTSGSGYGPFAVGTFHIADASDTTKTFSNTAVFSISTGSTANVAFQADIAGTAKGNSAVGAITHVVTTLNGVSCSNTTAFVANNGESNASLVSRCKLKLATNSPDGPKNAYQYFALTSGSILAAQTPSIQLQFPVSRVLVQTDASTGIVNVYCATQFGAIQGIVATPIYSVDLSGGETRIHTFLPHGLSDHTYVTLSGIVGAPLLNGEWEIDVVSSNTFNLVGSGSLGSTYVSGGFIDGGDLGWVDTVIQANAVPDAVTANTKTPSTLPIAVTLSAWVQTSAVSGFASALQSTLTTYFGTVPIGGYSDPGGLYSNLLLIDRVQNAIEDQAGVVRVTGLKLNGSATDLTLGATQIPIYGSISPTVHPV